MALDGPLLEQLAAPLLGGLLATGLPAAPGTIAEAVDIAVMLRAECRKREPLPGGEFDDAPALACPACGKTEHQAQARVGEFVCGHCGENYTEGA